MSAFVQQKSAAAGGSNNVAAITFDSNVTAGNCVVAILFWNHATVTLSTIVDGLGNTYSLIPGSQHVAGVPNNANVSFYKAVSVTGGACTVTATLSGNSDAFSMQLIELSGSEQDVDNVNIATGSSSQVTVAITTANSSEPIIAAVVYTGVDILDVPTGYTRLDTPNITNRCDVHYDVDVGVSGTKNLNCPFTFDTGVWVYVAASLKSSTPAPPAFPPLFKQDRLGAIKKK